MYLDSFVLAEDGERSTESRPYEPFRDSSILIRPHVLDSFFRFVYERQEVFYKRFIEQRPGPWTTDPILRNYKFTNVYRELDRGTLYVLDEIIGKGSNRDVVFNILVYRIFNKIETHRALGFQRVDSFDAAQFLHTLESIKRKGSPIFTNAFIVSGARYAHSSNKEVNIVKGVIRDDLVKNFDAHYQKLIHSRTLEAAHAAIKEITHFGDFLAYEAVIDINYSGIIKFSEDEWVNAGPGCRKGIDYIFNSRGGFSYADIIRILREDQHFHFNRLKLRFRFLGDRDLSLRNVEHSLCEFSKYHRLRTNQRMHARRFVPSSLPLPVQNFQQFGLTGIQPDLEGRLYPLHSDGRTTIQKAA